MRRVGTRRRRAGGIALGLVALVLPACSAQGSGSDAAPRATTTRPDADGSAPGGSTTTTEPPRTDVDPSVEDVPDEVFDGLGDPRIDVRHEEVEVTADPGQAGISGRAVLTLTATTADPLPSFTLDLRGPEVDELTVDGTAAEVDAGPDQIAVTPATPLEPGVEVEVAVSYSGTPDPTAFPGLGVPVGWQADDAGGWFTMSEPDGTATWVPVNDHPSDKATWTVSLDTPADAVGVSNGRLVSSDTDGERRLWVWETDRPMASYLVLAAIGAYDLVRQDGTDGRKLAFAFAPQVEEADRRGFERTDEILSFLAEQFGPYPDDDAGVIVVDSSVGLALETQTRPLFGLDGVDAEALAHELAHQWFGDDVSPASWADLWLNESFATYADWLWAEHDLGADLRDLADAPYVFSEGGLAVTDPRAAATFDGVIYQGGARALLALRLTIGDAPFAEILRRWVQQYGGGTATTADFTALAEQVSGEDLDAFFDAWLRSPTQPDLPG